MQRTTAINGQNTPPESAHHCNQKTLTFLKFKRRRLDLSLLGPRHQPHCQNNPSFFSIFPYGDRLDGVFSMLILILIFRCDPVSLVHCKRLKCLIDLVHDYRLPLRIDVRVLFRIGYTQSVFYLSTFSRSERSGSCLRRGSSSAPLSSIIFITTSQSLIFCYKQKVVTLNDQTLKAV